MPVVGPELGKIGSPPNKPAMNYPYLEQPDLEGVLEATGIRFAWARASECPCTPINDQTQQPDPNCPLCRRTPGTLYFRSANYIIPAAAGDLSDLQRTIIDSANAVVIRGVVSNATQDADMYDVLGRWSWGTLKVSVLPENKIGFYDRLIALDAELVFSETVIATAGARDIPLRYIPTGVNLLRSLTQVYDYGNDFEVVDGNLRWVEGAEPADDTRVTVHYRMCPTYRVIDHPHVLRQSVYRQVGRNVTPVGDPSHHPIQAKIRLEFLPNEANRP